MATLNFSTVQKVIQDTLDTSRDYLARLRERSTNTDLTDQVHGLLSAQGEVSGIMLAQSILQGYALLDEEEKLGFFEILIQDFGIDKSKLLTASETYAKENSSSNYKILMEASEAPRQEVLRRLNTAPEGTLALVKMREDLLSFLKEHPTLEQLDLDFRHLFSSWFNRGFLRLERIDWDSSADLLERIIRYEAVHSISDWDDLRQRVSAPDRACYAFFHPALNDEPLIFIEVALTKHVPDSIHSLLEKERETLNPHNATTAVFYSISNCQKGLRGVSFGAFLIKQVVRELGQFYSKINNWVTLSPVPNFKKWLDEFSEASDTDSNVTVSSDTTIEKKFDEQKLLTLEFAERLESLKQHDDSLLSKALYYFTEAKHPRGQPYDPVSRFHLNNGARLLKIHSCADVSDKGIKESLGVMVNYQYDPKKMLEHHEAYANEQKVVIAKELEKLRKQRLNS